MSKQEESGDIRKVILTFIITALIVTTLVSGASAQLGLLSAPDILGGEEDISAIQSVPEGSNFVARVDVNGLLQDETTDQIINSSSEDFIDSETPVKDVLDKSTFDAIKSNQTGDNATSVDVNAEDLGEVVVFGKIGFQGVTAGQSGYRAAIVEIDAEPEEVMRIFYGVESQNRSTQQGQTILEGPRDQQVAVVDDGLYIVGKGQAVQDSIDTALGEKESIDDGIVPEIDGDTHVHVILYEIGEFFGTFNAGDIEGLPVPNNASMTYTTTQEQTAVINIATDTNSDQELTEVFEGTDENLQQYENVNLTSDILTGEGDIRFEVDPDEMEQTTNVLQSVVSPNTQNIFNPPEP